MFYIEPVLNNIKTIIQKADYAIVDQRWSKRVFPYPHHRIYYVTDGAAELTLNDKKLELNKGYVYLLPAFSLVEAVCEKSLSHYYIHFQMISGFENNIFEIYNPNLVVEADNNTSAFFESIINNYRNASIYSEFIILGCLKLLLAPFFFGASPISPDFIKFYEVISYIDNSFAEKINVSYLAEMMQLDNVYFSNTFSKAFGLPPTQYILKKRLEKAQLLLVNTRKKVKEIALEVGFDNDMYFSRLFHKKIGMTPGEYRQIKP